MNPGEPAADRRSPLRPADWKIAAALAFCFAVIASLALFTPTACGGFHDDAIYLSTARSLAEGTGYRQINLPGAPPQTKYPILYPLLLAGAWKVWPAFPANLWLLQGLTLCLAAMAIGASYLYIVRFGYGSRRAAIAAVSLAATTPFLLYLSTRLLSEMPFALILVAALWRLEILLERRATAMGAFLSGVLFAMPFLCRSIGIAFGAVSLGLLAIRRRQYVWPAIGFAAAAGPWIVWSSHALGDWQRNNIVGYYTDYVGSWSVVLDDPLRFLGWNIVYSLSDTFGPALTGAQFVAFRVFGWTLPPVLVLIGALAWPGVLVRAIRLQPLATLLVAYMAIVLLWPWLPSRFLMPVLPFVLLLCGQSLAALAKRLLPTLHGFFVKGGVVAAVLANLFYLAHLGPVVGRMAYPTVALPIREVSWSSYEELFSWIRQHTDAADRLAAGMDSMVYLYTGRQAFRPYRHRPERLFYDVPGPKGGSPDEILDALAANGSKHLIVFPLPFFQAEDPFAETVAAIRRDYPDRFVPVFIGRDPRFMVFVIR